jgi:polar amino acid transport system substrate-binding protein
MKTLIALSFVILTTFICLPASAADKISEIHIASEEWENATNADGTGLYWDIFRAVYEPAGIKIKQMIRSYSGSVQLVQTKKVDAMVGAYKDEVEGALFPEWHFGSEFMAVLFKKETVAQWDGQKTIADKPVGWIKDYGFDEYLEVTVKVNEFDTREDALRVLDKGRIDFFIDAYVDLMDLQNQNLVNTEIYRIEKLVEQNMYLAFADTPQGKELKAIYDERFPELVASGEIKKLYEKYPESNFYCPF